jgi:hypothetical protein
MTSAIFEKLRKAVWIVGQPVSREPSSLDCPVSDLFIWRKSQEWETFFELSNLPSLFGDSIPKAGYATFHLFNAQGRQLGESKVGYDLGMRQTVRISDLLGSISAEFGTFAVFHSNTSNLIQSHGSYLTERGYVSYCYRGAPLRSYVHGNLDAIAFTPSRKFELLGSAGVLKREFRLQHEFYEGSTYEFALVNPCSSKQIILIELISIPHGDQVSCNELKLNPGESTIVPLRFSGQGRVRVVIKSRLVLARPLIFHICKQKLDVFHG